MTERDPKDQERDEKVEDLDVPESEADEVKGGAQDVFLKIDPKRADRRPTNIRID